MAHILVIDDDTELRGLLRNILERAGYEVHEATNGRIGLELQRQLNADLIITDIFMPEMDGTEFIMEIRDEFPYVEVIAMSGGGNVMGVDFLKLTENLGAFKAFHKPFQKHELLLTVRSILSKKAYS